MSVIQTAETFGHPGLSFEAMRIVDAATELLEPAIYTPDPSTAAVMGMEVHVPPSRPQEATSARVDSGRSTEPLFMR